MSTQLGIISSSRLRYFRPHTGAKAECCSGCSSRMNGIFCDLEAPMLAMLERLRQTSTYPAGVMVYQEGSQPRAALCVCSGRVKLSRTSPDGRAVVLGMATAGDVLGVRQLLVDKPQDHTAETIEETRLCFIPKDDFLRVLRRHGDVCLRLAQKLSAELGDAYRNVCGLVLKPAPERLAELLLSLCNTHGTPAPEGFKLRTNMCQDELAQLVGVSRRTLNRALGILRDQGLIECRRRFIIIRDRAALRECLSPES